jgi:hypothetical protein
VRPLRAGLVYGGVLVPLALVALLAGGVGLGLLGDDYCPPHAPAEAGSVRGPSLSGFPPVFVCEYGLRDGSTVTSTHAFEPRAYLAAWLVGTLVVLGGTLVALARWRASRRPA